MVAEFSHSCRLRRGRGPEYRAITCNAGAPACSIRNKPPAAPPKPTSPPTRLHTSRCLATVLRGFQRPLSDCTWPLCSGRAPARGPPPTTIPHRLRGRRLCSPRPLEHLMALGLPMTHGPNVAMSDTMAVLPGACHGSRAHDLRHHHRQQWTLGPVTSYC
jgi:hypothetical protein